MRLRKNVLVAALAAVALTTSSAFAADVYVTATIRPGAGPGQIVKVNVTPPFNPVSCTARTGFPDCIIPILTTTSPVDSLVLDTSGRYIFSMPIANEVRRYDPTLPLSGTNPLLLANSGAGTGALNEPEDMILNPTGTILYTSNFTSGKITLINTAGPFPNGTTCTIHTAANQIIGGPEGLAFDSAGRLYVAAGWNSATDSRIYEIDPTNCLIIRSSAVFSTQLDGLTYDPSTNRLFVASSGVGGDNAVYSLDVATLTAVKIPTPIPAPDGIINDQHGTLYVAARAGAPGSGAVYSINETTLVVTPLTPVPFIDDLGIVPPGPVTGGKTFNPPVVPTVGGTSVATITLTNPNGVDMANISFTDTLPAGVVVANPPVPTTNCVGGVFNPVPAQNATSVSFSLPTLPANSTCTVTFTVVDNNVNGTVSTNCVTVNSNGIPDPGPITVADGRCATLTMNVVNGLPLAVTKGFGNPPVAAGTVIPLNGSTLMTIQINNPNTFAATNVNFNDVFPLGLTVANPLAPPTNTCGGTLTAVAGATGISLAGATINAGVTCTISLNVTGITPGLQTNNVTVLADVPVGAGTATASLTVNAPPAVPPVIAKSFTAGNIAVFGTTTLNFLVTNPNVGPPAQTLTNVNFTDNLPAGLVVATTPNITGTCGGGLITAVAGANAVSLTGATLLGGASCTFSVDVTAILAGPFVNTTLNVVGTAGQVTLTGGTATALLNIDPPYDAYQINYIPNARTAGMIDLSNTGALGADPFGPLSGTTGRICANVYTFSPDEQEISCCSCVITPNAAMHITAADLIGNTATGVQPDSIVVKLLFTIPGTPGAPGTQAGPFTASGCDPAYPFGLENLAPGGRAWALKYHTLTNPAGPGSTFTPTETEFLYNPIRLGQFGPGNLPPVMGELTKLTNLCRFIRGNQSGAGLCKACDLGALGGAKK